MDEPSDTEEVEDFWPDLFNVDGIKNVRPKVFEISDPDSTIEEIKAQAMIRAADERVKQVEQYTSALDRMAMGLDFDQLKLFIAHYATYHSVKRAAKEAGGSVACFRHRRKIDAVFQEMWVLARENWVDDLEETGMDRATADVDVRFSAASNDMLKFMLKANSPQHQETVNVKHGGIEDAPPVRVIKEFDVEHLTETVGILHEVLRGSGS